jgi:hypothetical protein
MTAIISVAFRKLATPPFQKQPNTIPANTTNGLRKLPTNIPK